jgi:hypothetical protein
MVLSKIFLHSCFEIWLNYILLDDHHLAIQKLKEKHTNPNLPEQILFQRNWNGYLPFLFQSCTSLTSVEDQINEKQMCEYGLVDTTLQVLGTTAGNCNFVWW